MEEDEYWNNSENKAFDFNSDKIIETVENDQLFLDDENTPQLNFQIVNNEISLSLLISEDDLRQVLEEQSVKEIPLPKKIKPDDELKILRRKLLEIVYAPVPSSVVTNILMKKPYYLDCFKTFDEKQNLLQEAIASGDGDAILIITLFLINTLRRPLAVQILSANPDAICQYVNYLLCKNELAECADVLNLFGRHNYLSFLQYRQAMNAPITSKKEALSNVYKTFFNYSGSNQFYGQIILNYISLLDWQQNQIKMNSKHKEIFDKSVLETLDFASAASKWDSNSSSVPPVLLQQLLDAQKITQPQFEWIVLNERARNNVWRDLEMIFLKKNWNQLKSKTFSISIPLDRTVLQLARLQAPDAVLNYFLAQIGDATHRLELAQRVGAEKSIINALVELKDSHTLETYVASIKSGTEVYFYAKNALKGLGAKDKG